MSKTKKTYVIDTSTFLTNANAIYDFGRHDIVVPLKVLEEIDKHKNRQDGVGQQARTAIRIFDSLRENDNLQDGVSLGKGKGKVRVSRSEIGLLPEDLDPSVPDNKIISTALKEERDSQNPNGVIVVTRDINMRVVCDSIGLKCEAYEHEKALQNSENLYSGSCTMLVSEDFIDALYSGATNCFPEDVNISGLMPNECLVLKAIGNPSKSILARCANDLSNRGVKRVVYTKESKIFGLSPRNTEQIFAVDLLMDPEVKIVSLVGIAGSGKTLWACASALEQTLGGKNSPYKKIVVSRPVQPMGKDIGYLPGSKEEKLLPWLMPIQDNLSYLLGSDKMVLQEYMDKGTIEIEALTYIRGRSLPSVFLIIDESQNLSQHELKTILTRLGEGSKVVLTGDIEQIDSVLLNDVTNGLTHCVEKFKQYGLAGHILLRKGERSDVADLAAKVL